MWVGCLSHTLYTVRRAFKNNEEVNKIKNMVILIKKKKLYHFWKQNLIFFNYYFIDFFLSYLTREEVAFCQI